MIRIKGSDDQIIIGLKWFSRCTCCWFYVVRSERLLSSATQALLHWWRRGQLRPSPKMVALLLIPASSHRCLKTPGTDEAHRPRTVTEPLVRCDASMFCCLHHIFMSLKRGWLVSLQRLFEARVSPKHHNSSGLWSHVCQWNHKVWMAHFPEKPLSPLWLKNASWILEETSSSETCGR